MTDEPQKAPHPSADPKFVREIPPLLAPYGGARPEAPAWFHDALGHLPERTFFEVDGAAIELLTWGERGKPGLLFLHGNGAHADWWSFIAPYFARDYRCAAISWSGMGRSGWRDRYSIQGFCREALSALIAGGLTDHSDKPIVIAHSFGGSISAALAATAGEALKAVIIVDSGARPPEKQWQGPPQRTKPSRVSATMEEALTRFRLMPPQGCDNHYIVDYIARESLTPAPTDDGGMGWTWRFDPFIWSKMDRTGGLESGEQLARARCRLAFVWGEKSLLMSTDTIEYSRTHAAFGTPFISVPEAEHHVLLDQPLALIAALRALLISWS